MTFLRFLILSPVVCALAQTPVPQQATPVVPPRPPASITGPLVNVPPPAAAVKPVPPDRVVFSVGDVHFTAAEFDHLIAGTRVPPGPAGRKQFGETLVQMLVLGEEGRRRKIDETPDYKSQMFLTSSNVLAGMTFTAIQKDFKISDEEVHKYYDEHPTEFELVKGRHILIRVKGSSVPLRKGAADLTDAEALAKAQDIRKKILAGADFAELAKTESDDTGSGAKGGDLGEFGHGQMAPAFETAAFALKVGDLSDPVRTPYGYHIIQIQEKTTRTFEQAQPELVKRLSIQEASKQAHQILDDMVKKAAPTLDPDYFGPPVAPGMPPGMPSGMPHGMPPGMPPAAKQ